MMRNWQKALPQVWHGILLIGAGIVLALPFVSYRNGWMVLVSPIPFYYLLDSQKLTKSRPVSRVLQIYLVGLTAFGIITLWLYHFNAADLIANKHLAFLFVTMTYLIMVAALAAGFLVFGLLWNRLKLSLKDPLAILWIPALWAVGEYARSYLVSVVWTGPSSSFGPYWNFGALGFAASGTVVGYAARLVGLEGLSAIVVVVSMSLYWLLCRRNMRAAYIALSVVAASSLLGWIAFRTPSDPQIVTVGALQAQGREATEYGPAFRQILDKQKPVVDIMVLPEYAYVFHVLGSDSQKELDKSLKSDGVIVHSRAGEASQGFKNLMVIQKSDQTVLAEQAKYFLIPGGEYLPYAYAYILVLSGNKGILQMYNQHFEVTKAIAKEAPVLANRVRIGALSCSGAIAPEFYRALTRSGAEVLTNSAWTTGFGVSPLYYQEAHQMAVFMARANARPFVQSARGGESLIIDSDGNVVMGGKWGDTKYLISKVTTNNRRTPYTVLGEWMVIVSLAGLMTKYAINRKIKSNH